MQQDTCTVDEEGDDDDNDGSVIQSSSIALTGTNCCVLFVDGNEIDEDETLLFFLHFVNDRNFL